MFPVDVRHAARDIASPRDLPEAMARAVRAALAEHDGDILAFLPGMAEIRRTQAALADCGALVLPLHGDLPPAEQDRALRPAERRRVVLATSIAETSLTVPGVRIVVDGGWRRAPRLDAVRRPDPAGDAADLPCRGGTAGRARRARGAGRRDPAVDRRRCIAAWRRSTGRRSWRRSCPGWCWIAPPGAPRPPTCRSSTRRRGRAGRRDRAADRAWARSTAPGASPTPGSRMAALGAHPRLAAMMLAARTPAEAALAADLAALLEERDPLRRPDAPADIGLRLAALAEGDPAADRGALSRIRRVAAQYRRRLRTDTLADGDPGRLLAAAFPDRIAQRRGEPGSFRLAGGGGARLPRADPLASAPLLAVASLELKAAARIRLAAPLDPRLSARRPHHRAGGDQLRSGLWRSAGATAAAARGAGADRPHRAGRSRRGVSGARPRGGSRRTAAAALDRCRPPVSGAGRPDAAART